MENIVFERDYSTKSEKCADKSLEPDIFDYAIESGLFKSYRDAMRKKQKYIVPKEKEAYENLLPRLDAYAKDWHGKIKGVVDYEHYDAHITVELPLFEACDAEDFALLSDIAAKAHNVTFHASENGGIILYIMIGYFDEIEDTKNVLAECIMQDEKLVDILKELCDREKKQLLSDPQIAEYFTKSGKKMGITPEEAYDWFREIYNSNRQEVLEVIYSRLKEKNAESCI